MLLMVITIVHIHSLYSLPPLAIVRIFIISGIVIKMSEKKFDVGELVVVVVDKKYRTARVLIVIIRSNN